MNNHRRTWMLASLLAIVAVATAVDRLGSARADVGPDSLRAQYESEVSLVSEMREAVSHAPKWDAAHATIGNEWNEIRSRLLVGESADITYARLREVTESTMRELGLPLEASGAMGAESLVDGEPLRSIGIRIEFTTVDPAVVYRLIDRIEHLPDAIIKVQSVEIAGPGRLGRPSASVALELRALAWIGGAS